MQKGPEPFFYSCNENFSLFAPFYAEKYSGKQKRSDKNGWFTCLVYSSRVPGKQNE